MTAHPHPREFYIVHVDVSKSGGWGAVSDGPADKSDALEAVLSWFAPTAGWFTNGYPKRENTYVLHFQGDAPPRDETEDFIAEFFRANADAIREIEGENANHLFPADLPWRD